MGSLLLFFHVQVFSVNFGLFATMSSSESEKEEVSGVHEREQEEKTFKDLGLVDALCERCEFLGWEKPSKIQVEAIPVALEGNDVIGLAETGSGKTGAFALPVLQALLENPGRFFGLVLTPTRELAFQISEQFEALGESVGVKCAVLVGGMDMVSQAVMLGKNPHIIIATPGRLVDHLENTKGFKLTNSSIWFWMKLIEFSTWILKRRW